MRLLLVEDDRQLLASLTRGLREAGYVVDPVAAGDAALPMAMEREYDAIVLDILLPGLDGVSLCRQLRDRGNGVPILMLTALDAVADRIRGLDAGADDYVVKPFDFGELLARLRALTRRHGDPGSAPLRIADLTIDPHRRSARRGGREISLTAREFAFLVYLARNAGRVVSRAEIMSHVWDDSPSNYSNIIDVYASRLRKKVDEGAATTLFRTLRGAGYMLDDPDAPGTTDESTRE